MPSRPGTLVYARDTDRCRVSRVLENAPSPTFSVLGALPPLGAAQALKADAAPEGKPFRAERDLARVSTLGSDRGRAQVSVDETVVATVDHYAATPKPAQMVWSTNGLGAGTGHTILITVLGTKNLASTGTCVDIDAYLPLN
jgi:hypothetical protein